MMKAGEKGVCQGLIQFEDFELPLTAFGRLELEWCERKILLGWLELELVAGVV